MVEKYIKPYLDFYSVLYLPGLGNVYKIQLGAKKAGNKLFPPSFQYIFNESAALPWQHFVLFILQFENKKFEDLSQIVENECQSWKKKIEAGETIKIPQIGVLSYQNKHIALTEFDELTKSYGYPIF